MRAWKVGRLFGIDIFIHWTFLLLPLSVIISERGAGETPLGTVGVLAVLFAIFGCVVLHELGHALTARLFGIGTRDITLYPIGGVARMERMSEKPWEEFWIAVGGPAVNVVIALLFAADAWHIGPGSQIAFASAGIAFLSTAAIFIPMARSGRLTGRMLLVGGVFYLAYLALVIAAFAGVV